MKTTELEGLRKDPKSFALGQPIEFVSFPGGSIVAMAYVVGGTFREFMKGGLEMKYRVFVEGADTGISVENLESAYIHGLAYKNLGGSASEMARSLCAMLAREACSRVGVKE